MNESDKDYIEKQTSSDYFKFLAKERIDESIKEYIHNYRWLIRIIIFLIVAICAIVGFDYYNFTNELTEYKDKFESLHSKAKTEVDTLRKYRDNLQYEIDRMKLDNVNVSQNLEHYYKMNSEARSINQLYINLIQDELHKLFVLKDTITNRIYVDDKIRSKSSEELEQTKSLLKTLAPVVYELNARTELIEINSSIRYIIAERSDRHPSEPEFRPAILKLPYSEDYLKIVFYEILSDENPKEVVVDFYLNEDETPFETSAIGDVIDVKKQKKITFETSNHIKFEIISIFIYLPPNPLFQRIPDFVMFKVIISKKPLSL